MKYNPQSLIPAACTKSEVIPLYQDNTTKTYAVLMLGQFRSGKWEFGHVLEIGNSRSLSPVSMREVRYKTRQDALTAGLTYLKRLSKPDLSNTDQHQAVHAAICAYNQQQTLFPV